MGRGCGHTTTAPLCGLEGGAGIEPAHQGLQPCALPLSYPPKFLRKEGWWAHQDLNLGLTGYEPVALAAELWAHVGTYFTVGLIVP